MSTIDEEIEFLMEIRDVKAEYEAAREVRGDDPERYAAACEALAEKRSFWRQIAVLVGRRAAAAGEAVPQPAEGFGIVNGGEV